MKKVIFFCVISYSFLFTIIANENFPRNNIDSPLSMLSFCQNRPPKQFCLPLTNIDSANQALKQLYHSANKAHLDKNFDLALELYNQFTYLAETNNLENVFWKEIRNSLSYMSSICFTFQKFDQSIQYLKIALNITAKYNPYDFANTYHFLYDIGKSYYNLNDYNCSLDSYHEAEALVPSTNKIPIGSIAQLYNNLALCYQKLGLENQSNTYLLESFRLKKKLGYFEDLASSYNNLGLNSQRQQRFEEARALFSKSLILYDSLKNQDGSAFINNNIGNLFLEQKSYDSSKIYYLKSLMARKYRIMPKNSDLVISYNNLSNINCKLNILDSALIYNDLAINLNINFLKDQGTKDLFSISNYVTSMADRIEINLHKYNLSKNAYYLEESYALLQPTIKIIIDQIVKFNSLFSTNIFIHEIKSFFDLSMLSAYCLDSINFTQCPRTLIISETYKSLALINLPSEIRNLTNDSARFAKYSLLNKSYLWQERLLKKDKSKNEVLSIHLIDSIVRSSLILDISNDKNLIEVKSNINHYFNNLSDSLISQCVKLDDKLIIDYYITDSILLIHTISRSDILCYTLKLNKEFLSLILQYPKALKSLDQVLIDSYSRTLFQFLFAPISKTLSSYQSISIIPDQDLTGIPFESINVPNSNKSISSYLIDNKYISYRFTILTRNYSNINNPQQYTKEFFGITPFEPQDTSYHNLKGSAKEVIEIADLFHENNLSATILMGNNATYDNISKSNFDSRILHLSTHTFINNKSTHLSYLELFPFHNQISLFLPILSIIPFHNDLILLNSCETASNLIDQNAGVISFIRNLSSISIRNYICTLWKIYDEPSHLFIIQFYMKVLQGFSYSQALALAKREFIHSENYYHPVFWSPFILYENF